MEGMTQIAVCNHIRYACSVAIKGFRHKGLEDFFTTGTKRGIQTKHADPMKMHNPPHPGEVLRELCLNPLDLTVTEAAKALRVSRKTLSSILNGRAGLSPEMAVRLSLAFGTSAESWMNQQTQYDLWHVERRRKKLHVAKLSAA